MTLLALLGVIAAQTAADVSTTSADVTHREVSAWVGTVAQVRDLTAGVSVDLARRVSVEGAGWTSLDTAQPVYLRGGWLGATLKIDLPVDMRVRARGLVIQPADGEAVMAGLSADAHTTMRVASWFTLVPEFELTWLPPNDTRGSTVLSRISAAYRFHSGTWTIDAIVGAQAWLRDELTVAPFGELTVDWHGRFDKVDLGVGGGIALSRDGWLLAGHPMMLQPTDVLQPWLFARLSVTPRFDW